MVSIIPAATFVGFILTLTPCPASAAGSTSPLNCTNHDTCVQPFDKCDPLSGACQITIRIDGSVYGNSLFEHFWSPSHIFQSPYVVRPYGNRYTSVVCSEDGNYPSNDCRYFNQCVNGTSFLKSCDSPGYPYFDPVLERCTNTASCPVFKCFEKYNVRVGLDGRLSSFFAYCFAPQLFTVSDMQSLEAIPYVVTRCYGKDVLNANSGRCEPRCLQEGLLPDTTDCSHYYLCSLQDPVNSVFTMRRLSCPQGLAFLPSEDRCIPKELVRSCNTPRAWPL